MVPGAVNSEIVVELPGGQQIVSVITKESAEPAPPSKGGKSDPRIKEFSERFKKHTPQLQDVTDRRSTAHFTEAGMPPRSYQSQTVSVRVRSRSCDASVPSRRRSRSPTPNFPPMGQRERDFLI